jgi:hypothetical protein
MLPTCFRWQVGAITLRCGRLLVPVSFPLPTRAPFLQVWIFLHRALGFFRTAVHGFNTVDPSIHIGLRLAAYVVVAKTRAPVLQNSQKSAEFLRRTPVQCLKAVNYATHGCSDGCFLIASSSTKGPILQVLIFCRRSTTRNFATRWYLDGCSWPFSRLQRFESCRFRVLDGSATGTVYFTIPQSNTVV